MRKGVGIENPRTTEQQQQLTVSHKRGRMDDDCPDEAVVRRMVCSRRQIEYDVIFTKLVGK
jgi:hypothetical protein